ncbi:MAG: hypothetical protein E7618_00990 [Ruminococcaceae bacterium]|nr:hypothetical protein [Oscillospiraceae bacterium]
MNKSKHEMLVFRNARKGYDKDDVNRYIEEMNLRFVAIEEGLKARIRELEEQLSTQQKETDVVSDAMERLSRMTEAHRCLNEENEALRASLSEAEGKLAEAEARLAEAAAKAEAVAEPVVSEEPKPMSYEEAGARLGHIILKANLDADRIVAEAEDEGKRRLADAARNADDIRLDAAVTARLMTERAKEKLSALTAEYMATLTAFSEQSAGEYRKLCEELQEKFRQTEASVRQKLNGDSV